MNIHEFLSTIYVGDRGCKSVVIDGWNSEVKMQVTCISRVRSSAWNNYTDEDLPNGFLVFEGVKSVVFEPPGVLPNDLINDIQAEPLPGDPKAYLVVIGVDSVDAEGHRIEVSIRIHAASMALEASDDPGVRIVE